MKKTPPPPYRWFEQQRLDWITETIHVFGFINREHLQVKFGISRPQASADLAEFMRLRPGVITYDTSQKRYIKLLNTSPQKGRDLNSHLALPYDDAGRAAPQKGRR